jgi:ribosomal-protein-alanine N-acetyltransferase
VTPPEITAGRLRLVPWHDDDAPEILALVDDLQTRSFTSLGQVHDVDDAAAWIQSRRAVGRLDWAVRDAQSRRLLGRVGLMHLHLDDDAAEIGYWTAAPVRGTGIATQAVAVVTQYAFDTLGRHRLEIRHEPANVTSCRVAQKLGFGVEGLLRDAHRTSSGYADLELHARLATDPSGPPHRSEGSS